MAFSWPLLRIPAPAALVIPSRHKRRGFCPSCGARRMAEGAALLVDEVLPREPMRQWVLSVPFALRYLTELERALRGLRLSGMTATLEVRALQVAHHELNFYEAFAQLVQDELDRRKSRLLDRRFALSGLTERKDLKDFDWSYNTRLPKREVLDLATLKFVAAKQDALLIGPPGVGKSHIAKALAQLAVQRGYKVFYREAHHLIEDINEARELAEIRQYRVQLKAADLLIIDDLFLRRLPANAGEELADVLMSRYEKLSTLITSNRPFEDWGKLLGDAVIVAPLLDRLLHHGHLLKFDGKSWRLKEAAARVAKQRTNA